MRWLLIPLLLAHSAFAQERGAVVQTAAIFAAEARQAAAADERFIYAIDSAAVAKYDRATGERLATSTGEARHLNSGFFLDGKLYCAHSNYPQKPERSQILALDTATMALTLFKDFGASKGSLTWAVPEGDCWWCTFAFYGAENARTELVKFDREWRQLRRWSYPPAVIRELGSYSISGGVWKDGDLLVTGHDRRVIYRLRAPEMGEFLDLIEILPSPFPGQGLAVDPKTGQLIGIDRGKGQVIFAEWRKAPLLKAGEPAGGRGFP